MNFLSFIYNIIFGPLVLLFDIVYALMYRMTDNEGLSIIALSLVINILILPLYRRADALQDNERARTNKLKRGVEHIKKTFKGDERFMMLQTYYRQNNYKPYFALSGSVSLLLEIPFFIAAFNFLSELDLLIGSSFGPIPDLSKPDGLLNIAGHSINLLPLLMTAVNIVSGIIYTKGMPLKSKLQLYGMALIFLVLLYSSPSGLAFYWTLNNLFSLIKNLFYKLKKPKLALCIIITAFSACLLPYVLISHPIQSERIEKFAIAGLLLMLIPLPAYFLVKKLNFSLKKSDATKDDNVIFSTCCVMMTVLTGILIPSAVIATSPDEFVNLSDVHSPLRYVFSSFTTAAGIFLVWMIIFYRLASKSSRKIMSLLSVIFSGAALTNYMFFGTDYGNMSPMLQYDNLLISDSEQNILNSVVLVGLSGILLLIWKLRKSAINYLCIAGCVAISIMCCQNLVSVQTGYSNLINSSSATISEYASKSGIDLPLDKKGKNVVVIMLDRAINDFFPYMMEEKPELKEQFSGFTYYPNTISYGDSTLTGFPGLYGGYEYTPEEMNRRSDVSIEKKQDEALKVMPLIFSRNGYKTTVCDPVYAGMQWYPNLAIYDEYPEISKYVTKGRFTISYNDNDRERLLNRNMFAYSLFRISPVLIHISFYNKGEYNHSSRLSSVQVINDLYTASGGSDHKNTQFAQSYSVLEKLPTITKIYDDGTNNFLLMSNDTTHDVIMLQEPEYTLSDFVDNRAYENELNGRRTANGKEIALTTPLQITHYQCNMATMIKLGEWFDYLRQNGVYDNTRIIIVSDHGRFLDHLNSQIITEGYNDSLSEFNDVMCYKALLLFKDFDSSEFKTDDSFMTNADTPLLSFNGLIDSPVNPFTNNPINDEIKNSPEHHIAIASIWLDGYKNGRTDYGVKAWVGMKGIDTTDLSSWRFINNN